MQLQIQHKNLLALTLILFIESLCFYLTNPIFYRLVMSGNYQLVNGQPSVALNTLIYSGLIILAPVIKIIAAPFICDLSDRFGRKLILLICSCIAVLGFALCIMGVFTMSLSLLILGRIISGAADCSSIVALAGIADFTQGQQRTKYYAIFLFATGGALVIGPHLGLLLSDLQVINWVDISTPFWIGLALTLFNFILLLEFFHDANVPHNNKFSLPDIFNYLKLIWCNVILRRFLLVIMLFNAGWGIFYFNNFLFLHKIYHFPHVELGIFATVLAISLAIGIIIVFPWLSKIVSLENLLRWFTIIITIGFIIDFLPFEQVQWLVAVVLGISGGVLYVAYTVVFANAMPANRLGLSMGILTSVSVIAWLIAGILPALSSHISFYLPGLLALVIFIMATLLVVKFINFKQLACNLPQS